MKKMLEQNENTILQINERIEELKIQKKQERDLERLYKLERRIYLLKTEKAELMMMSADIKRYLAPKSLHPSICFKSVSGGN